MERLADISIDADGEDLVFRVRPGDRFKTAIARFFSLPASSPAEKRDTHIDASEAVAPQRRPNQYSAPDPQAQAELDAAISAHYIAGHSQDECRRRFNVGWGRVADALNRTDTPRRAPGLHTAKAMARSPAPPQNSTPIAKPTQSQPAKQSGQIADAPDNKGNAATRAKPIGMSPHQATRLEERNAEIERLYVEEEQSGGQIAEMFGVSAKQVRQVLRDRGVAMRTIQQAQQLRAPDARYRELMRREKIKPKPIEIPEDAPRVEVPIGELVAQDEARKAELSGKRGKDVMKETGLKVSHQKRRAESRGPLTDADRAAMVKQFFAEGGAVTVIKSPAPKPGTNPVGVGGARGRGAFSQ